MYYRPFTNCSSDIKIRNKNDILLSEENNPIVLLNNCWYQKLYSENIDYLNKWIKNVLKNKHNEVLFSMIYIDIAIKFLLIF